MRTTPRHGLFGRRATDGAVTLARTGFASPVGAARRASWMSVPLPLTSS
ncbi:hypothetical protein ACFT8W_16595 [Streptomyces hygroscopicus]